MPTTNSANTCKAETTQGANVLASFPASQLVQNENPCVIDINGLSPHPPDVHPTSGPARSMCGCVGLGSSFRRHSRAWLPHLCVYRRATSAVHQQLASRLETPVFAPDSHITRCCCTNGLQRRGRDWSMFSSRGRSKSVVSCLPVRVPTERPAVAAVVQLGARQAALAWRRLQRQQRCQCSLLKYISWSTSRECRQTGVLIFYDL